MEKKLEISIIPILHTVTPSKFAIFLEYENYVHHSTAPCRRVGSDLPVNFAGKTDHKKTKKKFSHSKEATYFYLLKTKRLFKIYQFRKLLFQVLLLLILWMDSTTTYTLNWGGGCQTPHPSSPAHDPPQKKCVHCPPPEIDDM